MTEYVKDPRNILTREEVYEIVDSERNYQKKWDDGPSEGRHSVAEFVLYMEDYLHECRNQLSRSSSLEADNAANDTLRKVVALGVACMEQNGATPRQALTAIDVTINALKRRLT